MRRLGVAAVGMYNRRKLHIQAAEIGSDLTFFDLGYPVSVESGRPMTQADLLLGSFFFIHKSKAGQKNESTDELAEQDTAFEFLHNTFGEFLTADFVLRIAFQETETLETLRANDSLRAEYQRKLQNPNGLVKEWFACMMYAPFYSRPVVLEMLREWTNHLLQRSGRSREDLLSCLDEILTSQIRMILNNRFLPEIMRTDEAKSFSELPLLGHIAIYTLNLIILRTVLDKKEFVFDESAYNMGKDDTNPESSGTRPWDKMTYLWRSWFSLENLNELTAVIYARRDKEKIFLNAHKAFRVNPSDNRLKTIINVAVTLADNITAGLAGLLANDIDENNLRDLASIQKQLEMEDIDLRLEIIIQQLSYSLRGEPKTSRQTSELVMEGFNEIFRRRQPHQRTQEFIELAVRVLRGINLNVGEPGVHERVEELMHPRFVGELLERDPDIAIGWLMLMKEFGDSRLIERYTVDVFERIHPRFFVGLAERRPDAAIEWLRLIREFGDPRWTERFSIEVFERMDRGFFVGLTERRPDTAIEWLRLIREFGDSRLIERYAKDLFERMDSRFFARLVEQRPDAAIEWLRLIREFGDSRLEERYAKELFERIDPRFFVRLAERRPTSAIEWLRLTKEFGDPRLIERYAVEVFERIDPKFFVRLVERRPDTAVEWLRLIKEFDDPRRIKRYAKEFFERFNPSLLVDLMRRHPEIAVQLLRMAEDTNQFEWLKQTDQEMLGKAIISKIGTLPIEYLRDIKWYAKETNNVPLINKIDMLL